MTRLWRHRLAYIGIDSIASVVAFTTFNVLRYQLEEHYATFGSLLRYMAHPNTLLSLLGVVTLAMGVYWLSGYYNNPYAKSRLSDITTSLSSSTIIAVIVFLFVISDDVTPSTTHYLRLYGLLHLSWFLILYVGRVCVTRMLLRQFLSEEHKRRIVLISEGNIGDEVAQWLEHEGRMRIVARLPLCSDRELETNYTASYLKNYAQRLVREAQSKYADEVVIATTDCSFLLVSQLLYKLYILGIPIKLSPRSIPYVGLKLKVNTMLGEPLVDVTASNLSESAANIKWLVDRLSSALGLILLSPLFLYIAWRISRESEGGILYTQERIGLRGRPFIIYKFRSMYLDAEQTGPQLSSDQDPRVTPWGRVMRRYRLDELPQLWNVLIGDMSLVGPRPERSYYIRQLVDDAPQLFLLHNVRPGITSWAMVRYGYASTLEEMRERMAYDWLYYENMSLRLDIIVLFYTIQTIAKGLGK
ncbi:sugar transferase [Porphyromonas sp. COT-290 OH860]|uniref:sugar transferase n=1 Tax=Porphyromonas sp. COT-290 OH860 TaxID=1515615 RepID=UPI00052D654B|nr:sugar transferase [Porphyromonas sp. COT-290 OH860]KGN82254.1 hypothetical protein HQ41_08790 [Porphyromonas sp. COT-290 OH860]